MGQWTMSRRSFLKMAGLASVAATGGVFSFTDWLSAAEKGEIIKVNTVCNCCGNRCGLVAHVKDGRLWKLTGQAGHPKNMGTVCPRGHGYAAGVYSPHRLVKPLKKVGAEFQAISWEQAYKEIGEKTIAIRDQYGAGAIYWHEYDKPISEHYGSLFMRSLGNINYTTHYTTCAAGRNVGLIHSIGGVAGPDLGNAKYVVFIGRSYADGIIPASMKTLVTSKEKGLKIVCVDPRYSNTAMIADDWLAIRPGTDQALMLAWAHVMIKENLYDKDFIEKNAIGFAEFSAMIDEYTPEWAAKITDIPVETISRVAREMAAAKPKALIDPGWHSPMGAHYINGVNTARMMGLINAMLGNINQVGGIWFPQNVPFGALDKMKYPVPPMPTIPRTDGCGEPQGKFPLGFKRNGIQTVYPGLAKDGKVKAGFIYHTNPVRSNPDSRHVMEGLKSLELCVVMDYQLSETAENCAHYVLPECHALERDEIAESVAGRRAFISRRHKVVERVHPDTRSMDEMIVGIAKQAGIGQYFNFTVEELTAAQLAPLGITPAALREKGTIPFGEPRKPGVSDADGNPNFNTPSKKVQFMNDKFKLIGWEPLPRWQPPKVSPKGEEFRMIHGHQAVHTHNSTYNLPYLLQISKDKNLQFLWMNAGRAQAMGIKEGDWVTVNSATFTGKAQLKVTERLHPEALFFPAGYGGFSKGQPLSYGFGINSNDFNAFEVCPASGHAMEQETILTVTKGVV
ncbi:MAG: molybdopterin-dependent oxidoreductase [Sporomusaceae bacterium]|nr:molybdopterin-dependent oxidoreductase [Sporomusaceae bacterium]